MTVPNTENFSLIDVKNEVELGGSTVGSLQDAFNNANSGGFDPTYDNDSYAPVNSMLRFRNYIHQITVNIELTLEVRVSGTIKYDINITLSSPAPSEINVEWTVSNYIGTGSNFSGVPITIAQGQTTNSGSLDVSSGGINQNAFIAIGSVINLSSGYIAGTPYELSVPAL